MDLWSCEKLLNMAEQVLGPDVAGHPVWNLRVKTPNNEATLVPWHQDSAYFSEDSYDHMVLTAWIPFLDTDQHNGGMQVAQTLVSCLNPRSMSTVWFVGHPPQSRARRGGASHLLQPWLLVCHDGG